MEKSARIPNRLITIVVLSLFSIAGVSGHSFPAETVWQGRWDKVLSKAKGEGRVVVLGPPGERIRTAMVEGFQKAYPGIRVEFSGGRGSDQAARLRAERDGGIFSTDIVLSGVSTANLLLRPIGALDPVKPALIRPEVTDPKYWRDGELQFSDNAGVLNLVFVGGVSPVLIYNLQQVKDEEVDELNKLLDPKWKGRIVISDPIPPGAGRTAFRWMWRSLGPEKAKDFYRKIRAQAGAVDRDQRRQIEWIAQGRYAILIGPQDALTADLLAKGLKFGVMPITKDYGGWTSSATGSVMLLNKAPHPNAATIFINWLLSKDGQTAWSQAQNHLSRRLDVPADHLPAYTVPQPGVKYWNSSREDEIVRDPEEEELIKELFGR